MPSALDRITVDADQCGGRSCIRGMRGRVIDVLELLAAGAMPEQILADLPYLDREDITAALQYAARRLDHPAPAAHVDGARGGPVLRVWVDAQLPPALAR